MTHAGRMSTDDETKDGGRRGKALQMERVIWLEKVSNGRVSLGGIRRSEGGRKYFRFLGVIVGVVKETTARNTCLLGNKLTATVGFSTAVCNSAA